MDHQCLKARFSGRIEAMSNKMKLQIGQLERQITDEKSKCDELKQRPGCIMSHMAHGVRDCERSFFSCLQGDIAEARRFRN